MRRITALLAAVVLAAAPLLAFALPFEEDRNHVQVIGRAADDPAYLGDPHGELEVTSAATGASAHVCGLPDDLRRWADLLDAAADSIEAAP